MLAVTYGFTKKMETIGASYYNNTEDGLMLETSESVYIKLAKIYARDVITLSEGNFVSGWMALMVVVVVLCMIFYVKGYKHNQSLFFLQTHAFLAFVLLDEGRIKTGYLYSLRYSYLNFGNALGSAIP